MKPITVAQNAVERHADTLAKIGNLGPHLGDGFFRCAWSEEESRAIDHIKTEAEKSGLKTWFDSVGNLYATKGDNSDLVLTGSHLDTVRKGGNYDGAIGVYGALEAIKAVLESGEPLRKGLGLVVWRGEESDTGGKAYKGSLAAFGRLTEKDLNRTLPEFVNHRAILLGDAIRAQGFNTRTIEQQVPATDSIRPDHIHAYIELHIEQSSVLEEDGLDIGVVTGIRGNRRFSVTLEGRFDHSGGTPMGKYRRDANLAGNRIGCALDDLCKERRGEGYDLVQTEGVINCNPEVMKREPRILQNGLTKVSGYRHSEWDMRSDNDAWLKEYFADACHRIHQAAQQHGVKATITEISDTPGLPNTDRGVQLLIAKGCEALGYSHRFMLSGPGHDAAEVAKQAYQTRGDGLYVPVGMIFVPCKEGISHDPAEYTTPEQITKGANVLARTLYELAK